MPTYAYRCSACSYEFEELQKITEDPFVRCPSCHQDALTRIIGGGAGLMFKGSGFYHTDYKKSTPKKTDSDSPKSDDSKSTKKAETPKKDGKKGE